MPSHRPKQPRASRGFFQEQEGYFPDFQSVRYPIFWLLYHPDKNLDRKEWAEEKFKEVGEAYTILNDDKLRAEYDAKGSDFIKKLWKMKGFVEEQEPKTRNV